jgi:hypothetical protein
MQKIIKFLKLYLWQRWRIPKGDYCYNIIKIDHHSNPPVIHTKRCPYWEMRKVFGYDEEDGYCTFLDLSDVLIWDQCKACGIRNHFWRELWYSRKQT